MIQIKKINENQNHHIYMDIDLNSYAKSKAGGIPYASPLGRLAPCWYFSTSTNMLVTKRSTDNFVLCIRSDISINSLDYYYFVIPTLIVWVQRFKRCRIGPKQID